MCITSSSISRSSNGFQLSIKNFVKRGEGAKEELERILVESGQEGFPVVLYHVLGDMPEPSDVNGFVLEKTFKNDAHTLMLYSKKTDS